MQISFQTLHRFGKKLQKMYIYFNKNYLQKQLNNYLFIKERKYECND